MTASTVYRCHERKLHRGIKQDYTYRGVVKMKKLEHNGAYKIADCVGKSCDVYLRIPAAGEGRGKVQISLNGSIHEFDAVSTGEALATGKRVKVVAVEGTVLTVE